MTTINNDAEFRSAIAALDAGQQRVIGARLVENVLDFNDDERVKRALNTAIQNSASREELDAAAGIAKRASLDSHTRCGAEGDWQAQAAYFVAKAAASLLAPKSGSKDAVWQAAVSCRMARTSEQIAQGQDTGDQEAAAQYRLLETYLNEQNPNAGDKS
ncbi:MAG: hypothetical protein KDJ38_05755 [Gammaproteobacteria bacterium]|nr:hypothetical protein [Gammaproteobacteria bacterium]